MCVLKNIFIKNIYINIVDYYCYYNLTFIFKLGLYAAFEE